MMNTIFLNKQNLIDNIQEIRNMCNKKICAVVKANAYGHGMNEIVQIIESKVDYLAVANLLEAIQVRKLTQKPILVLGFVNNYNLAYQYNISISLTSETQLKELIKFVNETNKKIKIHFKYNCGMNRLGEKQKKIIKKMVKVITKNSNIILEGLYTHFSNLTDEQSFYEQYSKFSDIKTIFKKQHPIIHLGGSLVATKKTDCDMIRTGIFMFGYKSEIVKPVMKVESTIISICDVKRGETIGYEQKYIAKKDMKIGVVPVGYFDGVKRNMTGSYVCVNKQKCQIVGNVCMDMFMIRLNKNDKIGDKVLIMDDASIWSQIQGTNIHEVLTNFTNFRGEIIIN